MRQIELPGRNDPCYCGSGRKFKKCHLPELMGRRGKESKKGRTRRPRGAASMHLEQAFDYVHLVRREIQLDPRARAFLEDGAPDAKLGMRAIFVETYARVRDGAPRGVAVVYDAGTNAGWQLGSRNADEHFANVARLADALSERLGSARLEMAAVASALADAGLGIMSSQDVIQFEWRGRIAVDVVVFKVPNKPSAAPGPLALELIRQGGGKVASPEELRALEAARDDPDEEVFVLDARRRWSKHGGPSRAGA